MSWIMNKSSVKIVALMAPKIVNLIVSLSILCGRFILTRTCIVSEPHIGFHILVGSFAN